MILLGVFNEDYYYGPGDFKDWPIDYECEDRDDDEGEEESGDENEEERRDKYEAENEAEQVKLEEEPEEVSNANTLRTSDSETSTTKSPRDHQRSNPPSSSPRISGQAVFATGQHHIWI